MTHTVSASQAPTKLFAGALVAMSLAVAGCQAGSSANTVRPGDVGYAITVKPGVAASGAVRGGIAGSERGGGDKAITAGAIGGAGLGGIAGNMIGTAAGTQQGVAITVQFDDGNVKAFIQPADANIQPGQPVNVEFRPDGAYVVPIQYAPAY